jgi:hypothetical protein
MLFALSESGVPSVAEMVRVGEPIEPRHAPAAFEIRSPGRGHLEHIRDRDEQVAAWASGTRVTAGLTSTCLYGLAACWAGAYQTLKSLAGVDTVRPIADAVTSTADVHLQHHGLPDVTLWSEQFREGERQLRDPRFRGNGDGDARGT